MFGKVMIAGVILTLIGVLLLLAGIAIRTPLEALGWIVFGLPLAFIFLVLGLVVFVAGFVLRRLSPG
jgi:hypothetical protein